MTLTEQLSSITIVDPSDGALEMQAWIFHYHQKMSLITRLWIYLIPSQLPAAATIEIAFTHPEKSGAQFQIPQLRDLAHQLYLIDLRSNLVLPAMVFCRCALLQNSWIVCPVIHNLSAISKVLPLKLICLWRSHQRPLSWKSILAFSQGLAVASFVGDRESPIAMCSREIWKRIRGKRRMCTSETCWGNCKEVWDLFCWVVLLPVQVFLHSQL